MEKENLKIFCLSLMEHLRKEDFHLAKIQWIKVTTLKKLTADEINFLRQFLLENQLAQEIFNIFDAILTSSKAIYSADMVKVEIQKIFDLKPIVEVILPLITDGKINIEKYINFLALRQYTVAQFYFIYKVLLEFEELKELKMISMLIPTSLQNLCKETIDLKIKVLIQSVEIGSWHINNLALRKQHSVDIDKIYVFNILNKIEEHYTEILQDQIQESRKDYLAALNNLKIENSSEVNNISITELFKVSKTLPFNEQPLKNTSAITSMRM